MKKYNPNIHHRRSIRLKGYDYSQAGLYFVTICCQNRAHLFGEIINGKMALNDAGEMIEKLWNEIPNNFTNIYLNEYIMMPNHIHGIIEITVGADSISALSISAQSVSANSVSGKISDPNPDKIHGKKSRNGFCPYDDHGNDDGNKTKTRVVAGYSII